MIPFVIVLWFIGIILFPWWVFMWVGIVLATFRYGWIPLIMGGIILDTWFGAPIAALGGLSYLYTLLTVLISGAVWVLRARMMNDYA